MTFPPTKRRVATEMAPDRRWALLAALMAFVGFLLLAIMLQYLSGAYTAPLSGYPDEPAHFVTGLMAHDYVVSGLATSPLRFAENYYLHYPKIGLGQWPPVFYVIQAVWTLAFSASVASVLVLMAFLASLLAVTMFYVIRQEFGVILGVFVGALVIAVPLVQRSVHMVMADLPVALFALWAGLSFGHYLDTERWQDATKFAVLASLAILTKGNALALAFVPPLGVVLTRRFHLVAARAFWLPVPLVLASCAPWHVFFAPSVVGTFTQDWGWGYTRAALTFFPVRSVQALGVSLLPFICIGATARVLGPLRHGPVSGKWAAIMALPLSIWLFHSLVSAAYEERYLVPTIPPLAMLLGAGLAWAATRLVPSPRWAGAAVFLLAVASVALFIGQTFEIPEKVDVGFRQVAAYTLATPGLAHSVVLISSEPDGEGMLIAEIAIHEKRPGHFIVRGTKVLSTTNWNGSMRSPIYATPSALLGYLDRVPIGVLVLDLLPEGIAFPHQSMLMATVQAYPERFHLVAWFPRRAANGVPGGEIRVYRIPSNENPPADRIVLDQDRLFTRWPLRRP